MVRLKLRDDQ